MNCEFWRGRRSTLWDVQRRQRTEDEDELSEIVGDVPPFRVQPWSRGSSVTDTTRPPDLPTSAASSFRRPAGPAQGPGFWAHSFTVHAAQREETIGPGGNLPMPRLARHAP